MIVYRCTPLPDAVLVYANPAALQLFGEQTLPPPEVQRRHAMLRSIWREQGELLAVAEEAEREGAVHNRVVTVQNSRGEGRQLRVMAVAHRDLNGAVDYVDVVGEDVTESMQLQRNMMQAEKLAALGRLNAAVAHEMNQPLNAARNYCQDIAINLRDGVAMSQQEMIFNLRHAMEQIDRLAEIIRNMRVFIRQDASQLLQRVAVTSLLQYPVSLMAAQLRAHDVVLDCVPPDSALHVYGSELRLQQVLINLLVNARDALAEVTGEKRITLAAAADAAGTNAVITVRDTGCGIPAAHIDRVFEPFFTTKGAEKGTGLGLAVSYEIIKQHHGTITIQSAAGRGTEFVITLPLAKPGRQA